MDDLICEIRSLLELGYEGGYWDFKSDYPDKNKKKINYMISYAWQII